MRRISTYSKNFLPRVGNQFVISKFYSRNNEMTPEEFGPYEQIHQHSLDYSPFSSRNGNSAPDVLDCLESLKNSEKLQELEKLNAQYQQKDLELKQKLLNLQRRQTYAEISSVSTGITIGMCSLIINDVIFMMPVSAALISLVLAVKQGDELNKIIQQDSKLKQ